MSVVAESFAGHLLHSLWHASVHGGIAIACVAMVALIMARFKSPAWTEHWLWKFAFLKLLLACVIIQPFQLPLLAPPTTNLPTDTRLAPQATFAPVPDSIPHAVVSNASTPVGSPEESAVRWQVVVVAIWILGVLANLFVLIRQWLSTRRLILIPLTDSELEISLRDLARRQGLRSVPRLATCDRLSSPALVGWFQPTIVFPPESLHRCNQDQLLDVMAHELGHYRRADLWWNLLPALAQVVFYFHPLLWLANHRWRLSSEMACDARAIAATQSTVSHYANSLLQIALDGSHRLKSRGLKSESCLGCVSVFNSSRSLKQRMIAMKDYQFESTRRVMIYSTGIALTGLLGILPWQIVSRADAVEPRENEPAVNQETYGQNLDFEEKSATGNYAMHWGGGGEDYELTLDSENPLKGKHSARIRGGSLKGFGTYTQCIDPKDLSGKRIKLSGFMKSDLKVAGDVVGTGGLWMRVDEGEKAVEFDNMGDRRIFGKTDWAQHTVILDVPKSATKICFGFLMTGKGNLWADDLMIQVVGEVGAGPASTAMKPPTDFANGDFEKQRGASLPDGWGGGGRGYTLKRDTTEKYSGTASGQIAKTSNGGGFGTFTQMFPAENYLGKRVRWSGFLKTKGAAKAGLWMRIDGPSPGGFDNMSQRPVTGDTDWKSYSVVLDVPSESTDIALGFLLIGDGVVWGDDLKLEVVGSEGEGPETTDMMNVQE